MLKLLAVDSSAKSASVAVLEDGRLISECFVNTALTHSCTLMPMTDNVLAQANLSMSDIDALAVNRGPGSFTGIRIGVAAVKGLAFSNNLPCAGVSTLESMAYNFRDENCTVCSLMDARCNQVYTALFEIKDGTVSRITDDDAMSVDDLETKLLNINSKIYLCGDGAMLCYDSFGKEADNIILPDENRRYQRAYGTGLAAFAHGEFNDSALLTPTYLRPPQAERELKIKNSEVKNDSNRQ